MKLATLITTLLLSSILTTATRNPPLSTIFPNSNPGHVTDATGTQYALSTTGHNNIRVITANMNGAYMKPISYSINAHHVCKFWNEATRGVGYLVGEFAGPVEAGFGQHWAAFF
ncbi:hypothetical protein J1614_009464 [Plenodomus biglobosus]|nr:hypothetical protein J1614_009464 [Plenodomus biglobosus]